MYNPAKDVKGKPVVSQNISKKDKTPKKRFRRFAITSLIIGISMIVVMLIMFAMEYAYAWTMPSSPALFFPAWLYLSVLCVTFAGLICGIIGLKSNRKRMAIAGITLCFLISIPYIFMTHLAYSILLRPWEF
jgi:MFS family permease